jgi:muramidase (phage lysozyme)
MSLSKNLLAFFATVSHAEGTDQAPDPYAVVYGYTHTITDFSDHPAATGEWTGEILTDQQCRNAGVPPGCKSTAAGRYQINLPTWKTCKQALGLKDFTPDSQDRAAAWLIQRDGALDMVNGGQFADAIIKCRETWASLPGNSAGQPQRTLASLTSFYADAGGAFA